MKRILLTNVVLTAFIIIAGATSKLDVPKAVLKEFKKHFGIQSTVRWERIDDPDTYKDLFVGHFIQNGIWSDAFFEASGQYIGIGKNITAGQLPKKLLGVQENKFKGYEVVEAYEYLPGDTESPVYGLTISNEHKMIFLKINESGNFSVLRKEKYKNQE